MRRAAWWLHQLLLRRRRRRRRWCGTSASPATAAAAAACGGLLLVDLAMTLLRVAYWGQYLPLFQRLAHVPGRDGTYAQNYQDWWALQVAARNGFNASQLFFVDGGSNSGRWCSNSRLLEERGWRGICVEPFPSDMSGRTCRLFRQALSDRSGERVDFLGKGQTRRMALRQGPGTVETVSFASVLAQSGAPKFLGVVSLDLEGGESAAVRAFPFGDYVVGAWIVENGFGAVEETLAAHGYRRRHVYARGVDEYFVRDEFWHKELGNKPWRTHPAGSWGC